MLKIFHLTNPKMRFIILFTFVVFASFKLHSQTPLSLMQDFKKMEFPFEYKNNLIIVDITLNRMFPMKFIFDTGAENTILAKREVTDMLNVPYEREFKLLGSDMKTELTAYLVRNIHFKMHDLMLPAHSMLVLKEDYFRFEEVAGLEIHGILGADVFRNLVVKINYERKTITLTKREDFKAPNSGYHAIPIQISRSKPYLNTNLEIQKGRPIPVKLLLDSGSMIPFIINTNTDTSLHLPQNVLNGTLGAGLGGYLEGFVGRTALLEVGQFDFNEILTHFQDISEAIDTSMLSGRNGIIGNELMGRFQVIIDYPKEMLYLKPNRRFNTAFEFDKSGLLVVAADVRLKSFIVHEVIPNSPADEVGVLKNDRITRINGLPTGLISLSNINDILKRRVGKKIKLRVKRGKEKMVFRFRLRKLI